MQQSQRSLVRDGNGHEVGTVPKWFPWLSQVVGSCLLVSVCLIVGPPLWEIVYDKEVDTWWYPYSAFVMIFSFAIFVWQGEVIESLTTSYGDGIWPGRRLSEADAEDTVSDPALEEE